MPLSWDNRDALACTLQRADLQDAPHMLAVRRSEKSKCADVYLEGVYQHVSGVPAGPVVLAGAMVNTPSLSWTRTQVAVPVGLRTRSERMGPAATGTTLFSQSGSTAAYANSECFTAEITAAGGKSSDGDTTVQRCRRHPRGVQPTSASSRYPVTRVWRCLMPLESRNCKSGHWSVGRLPVPLDDCTPCLRVS
jgi:hypothetical protein